jgi:hypothetical protein
MMEQEVSLNTHSLRVALTWNGTIFAEKTYGQLNDPMVTIGEANTNAFVVPAEGLPEIFQMFERRDDGYTVRFTDKLEGHITSKKADESFDLEELIDEGMASKGETASTDRGTATVFAFDAEVGDHGILDLGDVSIFFQVLGETPIVPLRGPFSGFEAPLLGFCAASAVLHLGMLLYAELQFDPTAQLQPLVAQNVFAKFATVDVPDPIEEQDDIEDTVEDSSGKKAGGDEGKFGAKDSEIPESKTSKRDGEMVQEIDVKNIGANEALKTTLLAGGPMKAIFGDQQGFDDKLNVAISGEGGDLIIGRGAGGMGMRGDGRGGGGDGDGRIAALGEIDTGGGVSAGGRIKKKTRTKRPPPKFEPGNPVAGDFCDKANLRRVVNAKSNAIRYCFEKELQADPGLSGKIVAQWKVGLDGAVMSASTASSTMKNKKVEGCINRVIKRMRFQKPSGGICVINYPFVFSGIE